MVWPIPFLGRAAPTVAVIRLHGMIGGGGRFRGGLSLASVAGQVEAAFRQKGLRAVALDINSPGGAPVQSALIYRRIRALAAEKTVPVFAFAQDVAASGGYWLLCAGDEIFADENSIVGSIGVVSGGFGLAGLIARLGIERRLHTSGGSKAFLDPFLPEKAEDVARLKALQNDIHDSFKTLVRERRAGKLKGDEAVLFSGEFWTGRRALDLGLIDGLGDLRSVMRARFGDKVRLRTFAGEQGWLRRRLGLRAGESPAQGLGEAMLAAVESRMLWDRYGL